jgi:hypothetical protein
MSIYELAVGALGHAYATPPVDELLEALPPSMAPKKEGGYRASLTFKASGLYLIFGWKKPKWVLECAMLFAEGVERFAAFPEPLDGRVAIASDRATVQRVLGPPSRSGGTGGLISGVIRSRYWDRYDRGSHSLRLDYEDTEGAIHTASLMSAELAARLNPDLRPA